LVALALGLKESHVHWVTLGSFSQARLEVITPELCAGSVP